MHTKGEWQTEFRNETSEIGGFRRKVYVTSFDAGEVICRVFGNPDVSVQENNARLIAAAPDLLAACKKICDVLGDCDRMRWSYEIQELNNVIKKVEGK